MRGERSVHAVRVVGVHGFHHAGRCAQHVVGVDVDGRVASLIASSSGTMTFALEVHQVGEAHGVLDVAIQISTHNSSVAVRSLAELLDASATWIGIDVTLLATELEYTVLVFGLTVPVG